MGSSTRLAVCFLQKRGTLVPCVDHYEHKTTHSSCASFPAKSSSITPDIAILLE
jgi:hypothetical protein